MLNGAQLPPHKAKALETTLLNTLNEICNKSASVTNATAGRPEADLEPCAI